MAATSDDVEVTYAVNYLSHFLMTHLMLSRGLLSPSCRVIQTATETTLGDRAYPKLELITDAARAGHSRLIVVTYRPEPMCSTPCTVLSQSVHRRWPLE